MEILTRKARARLKRFILKFPTTVTVYREKFDERQEPINEREEICTLTGFYHENKTILDDRNRYSDKGQSRPKKNQYFMVPADGDALLIAEGDFLCIRGLQYKITDLGNENYFDIYLDFALERWQNDSI